MTDSNEDQRNEQTAAAPSRAQTRQVACDGRGREAAASESLDSNALPYDDGYSDTSHEEDGCYDDASHDDASRDDDGCSISSYGNSIAAAMAGTEVLGT